MECKFCGGVMVEQETYFICRECSYSKNKWSKKTLDSFNALSDKEKEKLILGDLYKK